MRIARATFPVERPDEAAAFYAEPLGVDVPVTFVEGPRAVHHFAFHVGNLAAARARVEKHVPLLAGGEVFDFSGWDGAQAVYFHDAAGNVVELMERPDPRPDWTLAEVGLPVDDVLDAVGQLEHELGLPRYREADETFAPVGDADGLLIVVRSGRGWLPTDEAAEPVPLTVEIAGVPGEADVGGHRIVSR